MKISHDELAAFVGLSPTKYQPSMHSCCAINIMGVAGQVKTREALFKECLSAYRSGAGALICTTGRNQGPYVKFLQGLGYKPVTEVKSRHGNYYVRMWVLYERPLSGKPRKKKDDTAV